MWAELTVDALTGNVKKLPVPVTSTDLTLITGDQVFFGWSLREASADATGANEGSVTSPGALATIATIAGLPAGEYAITWQVAYRGTPAAADADNVRLISSGGLSEVALTIGAVGEYPQQPLSAVVAANGSFTIQSIAAGTVGAIYDAVINITPTGIVEAVVELQDGNSAIAEISISDNLSDTKWFGPIGVHVRGQITVHVVQGIVTGVVYAAFES